MKLEEDRTTPGNIARISESQRSNKTMGKEQEDNEGKTAQDKQHYCVTDKGTIKDKIQDKEDELRSHQHEETTTQQEERMRTDGAEPTRKGDEKGYEEDEGKEKDDGNKRTEGNTVEWKDSKTPQTKKSDLSTAEKK